MRYRWTVLLLSFLLACGSAIAAPALDRAALAAKLPGVKVSDIKATPIPGLAQVSIGPQVYYVTFDGRYLVNGDIIDILEHRNLTETGRAKARLAAIDALGEDKMIVYAPPGKPRYTINVFTDIDCQFCRKLHKDLPTLNKMGIEVRYMFFPRAGVGSASWQKAIDVWCSPDRHKALDEAKAGKPMKPRECGKTPVAEEYRLGEHIGVNGTPTIVTETGNIIPGYLPPAALKIQLDRDARAAKMR
jgi:thiol:disulfide interchange protein DsbC